MSVEDNSDVLQSAMEPRPNDMFTYQCSVHIDAPPERVFDIVGDLGRSADWAGSGQVRSVAGDTDAPVGVGTKYIAQEKIVVPFKSESVIVAYQPNRFIAWTSRPLGPSVPLHRWAFQLEPENGGTRLTHEVRVARYTGFTRLVQMVMGRLSGGTEPLIHGMEQTLANVKTRAES